MTEYLFSYGTLQEEAVQMQLFSRRLIGDKDILIGYKTSQIELTEEGFSGFTEQATYLIALPSDNDADVIEGTAFKVSKQELLLADGYEPDEYRRELVTLASGKRAWIYLKGD